MPDDNDLAAVNKCLLHFGVTMYRGADGRFRIWGDINRIQDIVDSDCPKTFPPEALSDLDWFFTHEVDARIVRCLKRMGLQADYEPADKVGFSFDGVSPSNDQLAEATTAAFHWYRLPPDQRGASGTET